MPGESNHLDELLANPPFPGIVVDHADDGIDIKIAGSFHGYGMGLGWAFGLPLICLAAVPLGLVITFLTGSDTPNWLVIGILAAIGLPLLFLATTAIALPVSVYAAEIKFHLTESSVTFTERGSTVEVPWADIQAVRVAYMKKAGWQAIPVHRWPVGKGRGDGIVIQTPNGAFKAMGYWHHEVSEWIAAVLSANPGISTGEENIERSLEDHLAPEGIPTRFERKSWITLGLLLPLFGGVFAYMFIQTTLEAWDASDWPTTKGTVTAVETKEYEDSKDELIVTYRYEVEGKPFTSDRYHVDSGYSASAERAKAALEVGDTVDVWYNPEQPNRAVLDRGFAWGAAWMSLMCSGVSLLGVAALIYAFIGKSSKVAQRYGKETPEEKAPQ